MNTKKLSGCKCIQGCGPQISEVTGNPITTVRNRIVRAKTKLRGLLAPYFEELQD